MHPHELIIEEFYTCFGRLDGEGMAQCYHENITFSDPVFPLLRGAEAVCMWKMLCSQAKGFELSFKDIVADDSMGSATWEAKYIFSKTQRTVHNKIKASFRFQDGKVVNHRDSFSFWKWSIMALGPTGVLLGWTPFVKNKVQKKAAQNLAQFMRCTDL